MATVDLTGQRVTIDTDTLEVTMHWYEAPATPDDVPQFLVSITLPGQAVVEAIDGSDLQQWRTRFGVPDELDADEPA